MKPTGKTLDVLTRYRFVVPSWDQHCGPTMELPPIVANADWKPIMEQSRHMRRIDALREEAASLGFDIVPHGGD